MVVEIFVKIFLLLVASLFGIIKGIKLTWKDMSPSPIAEFLM